MAMIEVKCPICGSPNVIEYGKSRSDFQNTGYIPYSTRINGHIHDLPAYSGLAAIVTVHVRNNSVR